HPGLTALWPLESIGAPRNSEDFLFVKVVISGILCPSPFRLRRFFLFGVAARLHQTAIQGRSRLALCLGRPTSSTLACALENHAFPTSALQNDRLKLRSMWPVRCRLDARAASGQCPRVPLPVRKPSHAGVQSSRRGRDRGR